MSSVRRIVGARRKVGATIAALALGVGVAVMAAPLTASAHDATLSASASCSTDGSTRTITYTGTTENVPAGVNATFTVTKNIVPAGSKITISNDKVATNGNYSFTEEVSGTAKSASAQASFTWGDGFTADSPVAPLSFATDCTVPTPPTPKCITAQWEIPGGDVTKPFEQPQQLVGSKAADCGDLTVVTPPNPCKAYQIDSYNDDSATTKITEKLLDGKVLYSANNPQESLETVKSPSYTTIPATTTCAPPVFKDATASVDTTPATCTSDGTVVFSDVVNGHWENTTDIKDGSRLAIAETGHVFTENGKDQLEVTYTYPSKLTGAQCDLKDATASVTTTPATCTTDGTVVFSDVVNGDWENTTDLTDGSRLAIAKTGHLFSNGKDKLDVTYTYPAKLTGVQCYPKDATASATVSAAATCTTAGTVDFTTGLVNATWEDPTDSTDGSRVALAAAGHLFADGTDREVVNYTIPPQLTNCDALASVSVATAATCDAPGTVDFTKGLVNATWDDPTDLTDGSRTATATTGHLFADGTATATVTYTIPSQLTNCVSLPPVTPPTVTPPVVSPPTVTPPTTATTTVTKVDTPTVTPEKTTTTTKTVSPTVLASTGINDSTPIAGTIALFALLFGVTIVFITTRHRRKTSGE